MFDRNTGILVALIGVTALTAGPSFAASPHELRFAVPHDLQRNSPRGGAALLHDRATGPVAAAVTPSHCVKTNT